MFGICMRQRTTTIKSFPRLNHRGTWSRRREYVAWSYLAENCGYRFAQQTTTAPSDGTARQRLFRSFTFLSI